jgi:hypothetical protein
LISSCELAVKGQRALQRGELLSNREGIQRGHRGGIWIRRRGTDEIALTPYAYDARLGVDLDLPAPDHLAPRTAE